jgi:hypothetical protein
MGKEEIEHESFVKQLRYLFVSDDSARWKGNLIIIAVGTVTGSIDLLSGRTSIDNAMVGMAIGMFITALTLVAFYSLVHRRASSKERIKIGKPLFLGVAVCSFAIGFGIFSYNYRSSIVKTQFNKAIEAQDYVNLASVIDRASTVSPHLQTTLAQRTDQTFFTQLNKSFEAHDYARVGCVIKQASTVSEPLQIALQQKTDQSFIAATRQPSTWNAVLISLKTLPTSLQTNPWTFTPKEHAIRAFPNTVVTGGNFDVSAVTGDAVELGVATKYPLSFRPLPPPLFDGTVFQGGRQTLDGIEWRNVTFVQMHISYKGGVVKIEGVRFVNCTFDLPPDPRGAKLAQYVALNGPKLEFGSAATPLS